jgi:GntR family transcriptional repressor for pyruvate dehydrogenase complex
MGLSGNTTLNTISDLLAVMVSAYYSRSVQRTDPAAMRRAVRSYRRLVEYIRAGDADGAVAHWNAQMDYTIRGHDPQERLDIATGR